jgi:hypothetical protein
MLNLLCFFLDDDDDDDWAIYTITSKQSEELHENRLAGRPG